MDYLPYLLLLVFVLLVGVQWRMRHLARRLIGRPAPAVDGASAGAKVYYFFSQRCGPCRSMRPLIERLGAVHPELVPVDITERPELARSFRVMGTPTFVRVEEGVVTDVVLGAVTEKRLRRLLGGE